jgi:hypothetical protein
MPRIKKKYGRYILINEDGSERRLTRTEIEEIKRNLSKNISRPKHGASIQRKGVKPMEAIVQHTNGKKVAEAMRNIQSIIMKAKKQNPKTEEEVRKSLGVSKYEK